MTPEILSLVRSALQVLGTLLVTFGIVGAEDLGPLIENIMIAVGLLASIGSAIWGVYQKYLQKKAMAVAVLTPTAAEANVEARKVLTADEAKRAAAVNLPPAKVTATGKVV